jgi:hypothetical protein
VDSEKEYIMESIVDSEKESIVDSEKESIMDSEKESIVDSEKESIVDSEKESITARLTAFGSPNLCFLSYSTEILLCPRLASYSYINLKIFFFILIYMLNETFFNDVYYPVTGKNKKESLCDEKIGGNTFLLENEVNKISYRYSFMMQLFENK